MATKKNGARRIAEVMTPNPITVERDTRVDEVARLMRDRDIGDVLVTDGGRLCGIATDRDLVVRFLASPTGEPRLISEFCSSELTTVSPSTSDYEAAEIMRSKALRRLPVVENGTPVGIVSIGDLARDIAPKSVLASISQAPPNI
ncbi:MAG: CBS domain-containing protein [Actinomycetota bacterium]